MPFSSAELTADEIALAAADKPIIGSNAAHGNVSALIGSGWDWSTGNDAAQPGPRAVDGFPGIRTTPTTAGLNHILTLGFTTAIEFDFFAIIGHNFDTFGLFDLTLRVADDFAFTSNVQTISTNSINPTDAKRIADLTLFHTGSVARRYSSVLFVEVAMLLLDSSLKPTIGQIIFGRRRQLKHEPNRPWDPTNLISGMDDFESRSGVMHRTSRFTGRRIIDANLTAYEDSFQADLDSWFVETNYGANPFIWIDKPNSDPAGLYLMHQQEPSLSFPFIQFNTREFTLIGNEQGPNFVSTE